MSKEFWSRFAENLPGMIQKLGTFAVGIGTIYDDRQRMRYSVWNNYAYSGRYNNNRFNYYSPYGYNAGISIMNPYIQMPYSSGYYPPAGGSGLHNSNLNTSTETVITPELGRSLYNAKNTRFVYSSDWATLNAKGNERTKEEQSAWEKEYKNSLKTLAKSFTLYSDQTGNRDGKVGKEEFIKFYTKTLKGTKSKENLKADAEIAWNNLNWNKDMTDQLDETELQVLFAIADSSDNNLNGNITKDKLKNGLKMLTGEDAQTYITQAKQIFTVGDLLTETKNDPTEK